ncbi:MAG: hypothetical protein RIR39_2321, partial [Pseudomonadota bacterium]
MCCMSGRVHHSIQATEVLSDNKFKLKIDFLKEAKIAITDACAIVQD